MSRFPDLSRADRFTIDCETTGLGYKDRPVGMAVSMPGPSGTFNDAEHWYLRWGHKGGGNNCTLEEAKAWAAVELTRKDQLKINHHLSFDMRMMAYENIAGLRDQPHALGRIACTQVAANLILDVQPGGMSLDNLASRFTGEGKRGDELWAYLREHFGTKASSDRKLGGTIWLAPGDVVEKYALGDSDATGRLWDARLDDLKADEKMWRLFDVEMRLMPILLQMHLVGVRVNIPAANELTNTFVDELDELKGWWSNAHDATINSGMEKTVLTKIFVANGIEVPRTKPTKNFPNGQPSLKKEWLEGMAENELLARNLLKLRHLNKLTGTFIHNYVIQHADDDALIHSIFNQVIIEHYGHKRGAIGGRFSSQDPNLQNIPARDEELAPMIRGLYVPYGPEYEWVKYDYSQIEYRFLAHYAATLGYTELAERYATEPDVDFHQMCSMITGIPRRPAKNVNFATVYGAGIGKIALMLGVDEDEAARILFDYNARLPAVRKTYERCEARASSRGWVQTWGGRKANFKRRGRRGYQDAWKALNRLLQGSAADLIKEAMVKVNEVITDSNGRWETMIMHMTVHDELDFSKLIGEDGDRMAARVLEVMQEFDMTRDTREIMPDLPRVPIIADYKVGADWGHTKKIGQPFVHIPKDTPPIRRRSEGSTGKGKVKDWLQ